MHLLSADLWVKLSRFERYHSEKKGLPQLCRLLEMIHSLYTFSFRCWLPLRGGKFMWENLILEGEKKRVILPNLS